MGFLTPSTPKTPDLPPIEPVPTAADPAVNEARRRELIAAQKLKGHQATLLTGGSGVLAAPPVGRKTLLGI